jgi:hypothetical protein
VHDESSPLSSLIGIVLEAHTSWSPYIGAGWNHEAIPAMRKTKACMAASSLGSLGANAQPGNTAFEERERPKANGLGILCRDG